MHFSGTYSKLQIKSRDGSLYGKFQFIYFLSPYVELWNVSLETSDRVGDTIDRASNHYHEAALWGTALKERGLIKRIWVIT